MQKEAFEKFKKEHDEIKDWLIRTAGRLIMENKTLSTDELIGVATVGLKKVIDFDNEAMNLIYFECENLSKLVTCEEEAYKQRDELRRYLTHIDTKLDGVMEKLEEKKETKVKEK